MLHYIYSVDNESSDCFHFIHLGWELAHILSNTTEYFSRKFGSPKKDCFGLCIKTQ